jgi:hypothetical protein
MDKRGQSRRHPTQGLATQVKNAIERGTQVLFALDVLPDIPYLSFPDYQPRQSERSPVRLAEGAATARRQTHLYPPIPRGLHWVAEDGEGVLVGVAQVGIAIDLLQDGFEAEDRMLRKSLAKEAILFPGDGVCTMSFFSSLTSIRRPDYLTWEGRHIVLVPLPEFCELKPETFPISTLIL